MARAGDVEQFEASLKPATAPVEETGFLENIGPAFDVFMDNHTSISSFINNDAYKERDEQIDRMIRNGDISQDQIDAASDTFGIEYDKLSYDLKRQGYDLMDDYDVRESIRETLAIQRDQAQAIHERASGMGTLGMFVGQMAAAQLDPVNIGAMFIPGLGMVRQGTTLARVGKAAAYYGGTSAGAEAVIQPFVHSWQKELGQDYTAGDSIANIALAGVGGAVIGTGVELGVEAVKKGFSNVRARAKEDGAPPELMEEIDAAEQEFDGATNTARLEEYDEVLDHLDAEDDWLDKLEESGTAEPIDQPDVDFERSTRDVEADAEKIAEAREKIQALKEDILAARTEATTPDPDGMIHVQPIRKVVPEVDNIYPPTGEAANGMDLETTKVVAKLDEVNKIEESNLLDEDVTNEMWADIDDDSFMEMTPEQRDEYVSRMLEEEDFEDGINWETGQLDGDGNMAYANKAPEEIKADLDEAAEGLDAFESCWMGNNGEE